MKLQKLIVAARNVMLGALALIVAVVALVGVKEGLADPACQRQVFAGIAPYAELTRDQEESLVYARCWLGEAD